MRKKGEPRSSLEGQDFWGKVAEAAQEAMLKRPYERARELAERPARFRARSDYPRIIAAMARVTMQDFPCGNYACSGHLVWNGTASVCNACRRTYRSLRAWRADIRSLGGAIPHFKRLLRQFEFGSA